MGPQSWRARDELQARSEDRASSYSPSPPPAANWTGSSLLAGGAWARSVAFEKPAASSPYQWSLSLRNREEEGRSTGQRGRQRAGYWGVSVNLLCVCLVNVLARLRCAFGFSVRAGISQRIQPTGRMGAKRRFAEEQARDAIARQGYSGPVCQRLCRWETGGGGGGDSEPLQLGGEGEGQGVGRSWDLIFK